MAYVSKEEFTAAIDEIKAMIQEMGKEKEEMTSEETPEEVTEEVKEVEMSEAPAAKKVAAAPVEKKPQVQNFSKSGRGTTLARVYSKLS
jgi:peptidoglycan hydrolase CwlO-like protein